MADRATYQAGLPRRVTAAGLLVTDSQGRVLVVEPTYKPGWEIPGGVVELGETARSAAAREGHEELGLTIAVGRLLVVEHQIRSGARGDAIMFLYEGGEIADPTTIRLPPEELAAYRFVDAEELEELLPGTRSLRLRAALKARASGTVVELVDRDS